MSGGIKPRGFFGLPPSPVLQQRRDLLAEELAELEWAESNHDLAAWAAEMVDVIYVLVGSAICAGVDLRPIWDAIHEANMQKVPAARNDTASVYRERISDERLVAVAEVVRRWLLEAAEKEGESSKCGR